MCVLTQLGDPAGKCTQCYTVAKRRPPESAPDFVQPGDGVTLPRTTRTPSGLRSNGTHRKAAPLWHARKRRSTLSGPCDVPIDEHYNSAIKSDQLSWHPIARCKRDEWIYSRLINSWLKRPQQANAIPRSALTYIGTSKTLLRIRQPVCF